MSAPSELNTHDRIEEGALAPDSSAFAPRSSARHADSSPRSGDLEGTFERCAAAVSDYAARNGFERIALPHEFASASARGGRFRLEASAWRTPDRPGDERLALGAAEARCVAIHGPRTEILTCLIFPARPDWLPVFATELVAVGGAPRVAFLDLQTPGLRSDRLAVVAELARDAGAYFPAASRQAAPDWAAQFSSGAYVFSRDDRLERLAVWEATFTSYLEAWRVARMDALDHARRGDLALVDNPFAKSELARYRREHVAHSPGTPFLKTIFGTDWTDRFLEEFLYA